MITSSMLDVLESISGVDKCLQTIIQQLSTIIKIMEEEDAHLKDDRKSTGGNGDAE